MKIILDTHIFLWAVASPDRLSEQRRGELETLANIVYLSAVVVAELAIKSSLGKLNLDFDPLAAASDSGFELLDFSPGDALLLKDLPFHHRDPFDRMLVVQAISRKATLMSDDELLAAYDCRLA